jgi:hypothetical protein
MRLPSKRTIRGVLLLVVVASVATLGNGALGHGTSTADSAAPSPTSNTSVPRGASIDLEPRINNSTVQTERIPRNAEVTVIATQGFFVSDENAELTAITRNGTIVYHNSTYKVYFDVDPVEGTRWTVEYIASAQLNGRECPKFDTNWCTENVIERVNLSTGEVERLYTRKTPRVTATRSHDFDRINETHIAIADIYDDRVFIYDTQADQVEWQWNATSIYDESQGGPDGDWSHINDIELLDDGRIMVSVRNMDEVVFIEPGEGAEENWTLGTDENHSILYEQHNPDYIPAERGGPSVIVGDSENNRVVEYHREDGTWSKTWSWRDPRMQWPRDADRLPNGRTLVVDSHGDRVMELSPNGSIAWKVHVGMPYDVERLGTGDESTGGSSIGTLRGASAGPARPQGLVTAALLTVKDAIPARWVNSVLYVGPAWFRFHDVVTLGVLVSTLSVWGVVEYRWSSRSVASGSRAAWDWISERF